ncbi:MAG: helix-turn-helix transcriptional regulator [Rhodospirillum sp.]|nr:helix-turn-helix transcriptional regulator [Rhodospirillum sp.]MCF8489900.1 helix-turn-helix transcriptional regulator [Rhodospirillum sp.]MCF8502962.1 helix-turn-helix transcriptional regulator [Rhodospirillum sp.]
MPGADVKRPFPAPRRDILTRVVDWAHGTHIRPHSHEWWQLVYSESGVISVETDEETWVVPPDRAVWVPAGVLHQVRAPKGGRNRSLYITSTAARRWGLPEQCRVVAIPPLVRELILEFGHLPEEYDEAGPDGRLAHVILDRLAGLREVPLNLPWPKDGRALAVARGLEADPADNRPLEAWAGEAGASARTLARLFQRDCGLTFGQWRQRLRLLAALERLGAGASVTAVALDLGYDSTSAFIAMFRNALGVTPGTYARNGAR